MERRNVEVIAGVDDGEHALKRSRTSSRNDACTATSDAQQWEEHFSRTYQATYWFNKRTGESSWVDPRASVLQHSALVDEDSPRIALRREQLRLRCLLAFAEENSKYGKMQGWSKTARSCREDGMVVGLQGMFARVLWSQKMRETLAGSTHELDPVFPSHITEDRPVIKELIDAGREEDNARSVLSRLTSEFQAAAEELASLKAQTLDLPQQRVSLRTKAGVLVGAHDELVAQQPYKLCFEETEYELRGSHLAKLLRLYRQYTHADANWEDADFLRRVFCVVARYETLSSTSDGYQMAFPASGFNLLQKLFGVEAECFASPLNVTLDKFCSVAFDTDRFFGSAGSFWKFPGRDPRWSSPDPDILRGGGSYEANPPFVEEVMDEMAVRIIALLQDAEERDVPLSFCVIVPGWGGDWKLLKEFTNSEFSRPSPGFYLVLDRKKHNYRPGMQHRAAYDEQPSNVETFVFFLQTAAGARKWPVTDDKLGELKRQLENEAVAQTKRTR